MRREKADWRTGFAVEVWAARGKKRSKWRRVAATGVEFAYLWDHEMSDGSGRILTIPVN